MPARAAIGTIQKARECRAQGMTARQVALLLGVSHSAVLQWEKATSCETCGDLAPAGALCNTCARRQQAEVVTYWTRERILDVIVGFYVRHGRAPTLRDWEVAYASAEFPSSSTVRREFGSWNRAISAAGLTPRRKSSGGPRVNESRPALPTVAHGFAPEEELAWLIREQKRDARRSQYKYDLSIDAPFVRAWKAFQLHDEWLSALCERLDTELGLEVA